MNDEKRQSLFAAIDREAADPAESADSKMIYDALREGAGRLGAAAEIPAEDRRLSESIHEAASRRSHELRTGQGYTSSVLDMQRARPVPLWLWIAWIVVIVGGAWALWYL